MDINEKLILKAFGEHVADLRNAKKLTTRKLAEKCKITNSRITHIEKGQLNITLLTLIDLAQGLEIPVSKLVNFKY